MSVHRISTRAMTQTQTLALLCLVLSACLCSALALSQAGAGGTDAQAQARAHAEGVASRDVGVGASVNTDPVVDGMNEQMHHLESVEGVRDDTELNPDGSLVAEKRWKIVGKIPSKEEFDKTSTLKGAIDVYHLREKDLLDDSDKNEDGSQVGSDDPRFSTEDVKVDEMENKIEMEILSSSGAGEGEEEREGKGVPEHVKKENENLDADTVRFMKLWDASAAAGNLSQTEPRFQSLDADAEASVGAGMVVVIVIVVCLVVWFLLWLLGLWIFYFP